MVVLEGVKVFLLVLSVSSTFLISQIDSGYTGFTLWFFWITFWFHYPKPLIVSVRGTTNSLFKVWVCTFRGTNIRKRWRNNLGKILRFFDLIE